jgi:hypothetical protein
MFETFSARFESIFRVIFIIWVSFWGLLNLGGLLVQYASFSTSSSDLNLGEWWLNTMATVLTITVGLVLLFFMSTLPGRIKNKKKIGSIPLMLALVVVYYLFATGVQIFAKAIFSPTTFATDFVFLSAWLFPSIILMVIHILYFVNLSKYNEELSALPVK